MRATDVRRGPEIWIRGPVAAPDPGPEWGSGPGPGPDWAPGPGWGPGSESGSYGPAGVPRRFSWLAAHGGAGASTLAAVYGGHDCGRDWPGPDAPPSVLLVARTHASGLECALRALEMFRRGETPPGLGLDAVVLVADAPGRLPRPLAHRLRLIESAVDVYRVPWVTSWRLGDLSGEPPRGTEPLTRLTGTTTGRPR